MTDAEHVFILVLSDEEITLIRKATARARMIPAMMQTVLEI